MKHGHWREACKKKTKTFTRLLNFPQRDSTTGLSGTLMRKSMLETGGTTQSNYLPIEHTKPSVVIRVLEKLQWPDAGRSPAVTSPQSQCLICIGIAGRGRRQVAEPLLLFAHQRFLLVFANSIQLDDVVALAVGGVGAGLVFVWLIKQPLCGIKKVADRGVEE